MENSKSPTVISYTGVIRTITDTTQTRGISLLLNMNNKYMELGVN